MGHDAADYHLKVAAHDLFVDQDRGPSACLAKVDEALVGVMVKD